MIDNYFLQHLKIIPLIYRSDIAARNFLNTESGKNDFQYKYFGNSLSKILIIVKDIQLFAEHTDVDDLFLKMLKSINLTINDVFVLNYTMSKHENLAFEFLEIFNPDVVLVLGDFNYFDYDPAKHESIDFKTIKIILSHSLTTLKELPASKKDAYKHLLLLKKLTS